jgi:MFS family permease
VSDDRHTRPVTFRDVFAIGEYRAVYFALLVSWIGDYLARAAVTVLVYQRTESVLLSAAAFAVTYLPWLIGGPVLSALAERYPYRRVMVFCDLGRMALILVLAVPGIPTAGLVAVLFLVTLGGIPAQAARSATLPLIMDRSQLGVAMSANLMTTQAAQVVGYITGATLTAAVHPRLAILIDALAFGISALLIWAGVRHRPAAFTAAQRTHLLHETAAGFRLVFGGRVLRSIVLLVFALSAFAIVPEGLAAAWAAQDDPDSVTRGLDQGMIMAAGPVGFVIGSLVAGRLVSQQTRYKLIRPLAVCAPLVLVPALTGPPVPVVVLLTLLSGVATGGVTPTLNTQFVLALPHGYRARAFGVVQQGLQVSQGGAVLLTGALASASSVPLVVGLWSVGGVLLMLLLALRWPSAQALEDEIHKAEVTIPPPDETHGTVRVSGAAGRMDG